ncbi:uncharacterized protein LOC132050216 isoform X2 [Lycium ferocissimum]|uniref:uncharacterized protein LOC132050216 isoform X2 n=1 Tax=Lycium ferocissimum TaxID=112874 RepID=UPI0028167EAF|nr:uncharacterized protein LOC132050216 isoform X2 [Lycium ferocissimum]
MKLVLGFHTRILSLRLYQLTGMSKPRGSNANKWTDNETSMLIHILHDDARKYAINGSSLNGPCWRKVIDEFWMKSYKKDVFDEPQIKSKYNRLRTETKKFKDILTSCSGYGWDPETNTITCPSEIWADYVLKKKEKNINISKYRYKGLEHFDLLREIFGKSFSTGERLAYSTMNVSSQRSNEATEVDKKPFFL